MTMKSRSITCSTMIRFDCTVLNDYLYHTSETLAQRVLKHVAQETINDAISIKDEFKEIVEILNKRSGKSEQLVDAEAYMKSEQRDSTPKEERYSSCQRQN